jgi:hypothetical protein
LFCLKVVCFVMFLFVYLDLDVLFVYFYCHRVFSFILPFSFFQALEFADLHDTPGRMKRKNVVLEVLDWYAERWSGSFITIC